MNKKSQILIGIIVVAIIVFGIWYLAPKENGEWRMENGESSDKNGESVVENPELIPVETEQFTKTYNSPNYHFSFRYPEGYTASAFGDFLPDGTEASTIVVQDASNLQGFQIRISPFDEDIDMTEERIRKDIPDLEIREAQVVELGTERTGLAFLSDNEAYGGASREVWFVFRGNFYQISTYASLDALLQQVLQTWQFE